MHYIFLQLALHMLQACSTLYLFQVLPRDIKVTFFLRLLNNVSKELNYFHIFFKKKFQQMIAPSLKFRLVKKI
jgi:hypothetical protein